MTEEGSKKSRFVVIASVLFFVLTCWWVSLFFLSELQLESQNLLWAASYQLVAVFGGVAGLTLSRYWGGLKSIVGRAIISLSIGLLFQVLGQTVFSFYNIFLKVEVPYPSLADIGFFGSIPFYIYGAFLLGKASGGAFSLKSFKGKVLMLVIPLLLLFFSYSSFLKGYEFSNSESLRVFLDFGYPLGQALYVSMVVLAYVLSVKYLGGVMKNKILLVLAALVIQYIADYNFLSQAAKGTWTNGGYGDYIYLVAYFLMTLSLINLSSLFEKKIVRQNDQP